MFIGKKVILFIGALLLSISLVFIGSCATNDPLDLMYIRDLWTFDTGTATWVKLPGAGGAGDMLRAVYDPDLNGVIATAQLDTGLTLVDGSRPFTGTVGGIDPVASTDLTTKEYVDTAISGRWEYFYNNTASGIGAYYSMGVPTGEVESSFSTAGLGTGDNQALTSFITDASVGYSTIRAGVIVVHIHAEKTAGTKPVTIHAGIYERTAGGAETLISTTENSALITAKAELDIHATVGSDYEIAATSKLVVKFLANVGAAGSNATVVLYAEGTTSSEVSVAAPMTGTFHTQNTDTRIQDADSDTKIQTEEAADEDKIRFDTGGTERLVLDSTGLDFKTLKAIAMSCDNGATIPASPATGQWFLHTPTGRSILMQYSGSAWIPIISFGTMTVYVDKTDGSDSADKGTGVDANAFKTVQYAINAIPPLFSGDITINVNGETYAEDVVIRGKAPTGNYKIVLQGTLTESRSASQTGSVQGATTTYGSISDTGNLGSYDNKLIWSSNNAEYRVIDSDDANTATIVGYWTAAPSGNYKIYDWATQIRGLTVDLGAVTVTVYDTYFNQTNSGYALDTRGAAKVELYRSKFSASTAVTTVPGSAQTLFFQSYITTSAGFAYGMYAASMSYTALNGCKIAIGTDNGFGVYVSQASVVIFTVQPSVVDGAAGGNKLNYGFYVSYASLVSMENIYNKVRSCDTGIYAEGGSSVLYTTNNQYSLNGTNESAVAASYSYID